MKKWKTNFLKAYQSGNLKRAEAIAHKEMGYEAQKQGLDRIYKEFKFAERVDLAVKIGGLLLSIGLAVWAYSYRN